MLPPVFRTQGRLSGDPVVGETLKCESGAVLGDKPMTFTFAWKRESSPGSSSQTIANQTTNQYKLTGEDEGKYVFCEVKVENSSGSDTQFVYNDEIVRAALIAVQTPIPTPVASVEPTATPTPEPTPIKIDSVPPKVRLLKKQAGKSTYQLVFTASDDAGDNNISRIEATSVRTSVEQCKIKGKKSTRRCKTTKSEFFMADFTDGSGWTISLPRRAQADRYTLFVRAIDKAGNVQSAPTRVALVVKQSR
jgi:hypothetical protein